MPSASLAAERASRRLDRVALAGQILRPRRRARGLRARRRPLCLTRCATCSAHGRSAVLRDTRSSAAFADAAWQRQMRTQLEAESARLAGLLHAQRSSTAQHAALRVDRRSACRRIACTSSRCAASGRVCFPRRASVRFGLPGERAGMGCVSRKAARKRQAIDAARAELTARLAPIKTNVSHSHDPTAPPRLA